MTMDSMVAILLAWLAGVLSGLLVSIPVGPVNVTIVNEGAQRGFRWAVLIGLGSVVMEVVYCAAAFAGFTGLFDSHFMKAAMELISFLLCCSLDSNTCSLVPYRATQKAWNGSSPPCTRTPPS
jgi:arginine exporter protein ArgO